MKRGVFHEVRFETCPDPDARFGAASTLVLRYEDEDYAVLGVFQSEELAEVFIQALLAAPSPKLPQ
ncbi:MAG TPA: hypothetical protein V6D47_16255 [Oscillatoriaceae cyanobacterium]